MSNNDKKSVAMVIDAVEKQSGRDIRAAGYKAYVKRKKEKAMKTRANQELYGDSYSSYDSGSNDSYSGNGGDSGGGGSDRSF